MTVDPDPDGDFDEVVTERRLERWHQAAVAQQVSVAEWVPGTLRDFSGGVIQLTHSPA